MKGFQKLVKVERIIISIFYFLLMFNPLLQSAQQSIAPVNNKVYLVYIEPRDLVIGRPDAPVTIVSYTSLTCMHCAEFHNKTIPALYNDYIKTGKLKIVMRHFPLDKISLYAAVLVDQAPDDQRLNRLNLLFQKQNEWLFDAQTPEVLAQLCGMSLEYYKECVENKDNQSPILKQWLEAKQQFDIEATPSFIIQGRLYEGLLSLDEFKKLIDTAS